MITLFYLVFSLVAIQRIGHLSLPWFAIVGAVTYPFYLIHDAVGQIIFHNFNQGVN